MSKVWFITGTSTGLGRTLAEEVVRRGDKLVATVRKEGNSSAGGAGGRSPLAGARGVLAKPPSFSRAAAGGARHEVLAPDMPGACQQGT